MPSLLLYALGNVLRGCPIKIQMSRTVPNKCQVFNSYPKSGLEIKGNNFEGESLKFNFSSHFTSEHYYKHINRTDSVFLFCIVNLHALMGTDSICNVSHVIIHVTMWTGFWVEDRMCSVMLTYDRIVRLVWVVSQYKLVTHPTCMSAYVRWCWVAVFALLSFLDVCGWL